jgi:hypothetical protein
MYTILFNSFQLQISPSPARGPLFRRQQVLPVPNVLHKLPAVFLPDPSSTPPNMSRKDTSSTHQRRATVLTRPRNQPNRLPNHSRSRNPLCRFPGNPSPFPSGRKRLQVRLGDHPPLPFADRFQTCSSFRILRIPSLHYQKYLINKSGSETLSGRAERSRQRSLKNRERSSINESRERRISIAHADSPARASITWRTRRFSQSRDTQRLRT